MELLLKVFALCVITAAVASLLRRNEGELALLLALCAAAAARFSQAQRQGKFSIAPIAALALTIGGFFPRMGAASTFIWAFVAAAGAGLCVVLLQKGETEDAEKQDFRVRQDA